ncbi:MAG: SBBP repeat-containing protein [Saprospiraceae bacterium]|nr:SBBP repeat-containing protein [Saprospiraceae bacterium]
MSIKITYTKILLALLLIFSNDCFGQNLDWAASIGGIGWDNGKSITTDNFGNIYVTGEFQDTVDFDPGINTTNLISGGNQDIFISKFDSSGNLIWAKQIGGSQSTSFEQANCIQLDENGNIYVTGSYMGQADFDPGNDTFYINALGAGVFTAFICKLDKFGNFVWAKQLGGTLASESNSIAVDQNGNVYTTGYFDGIADFDPGINTFNLVVNGYSDIFISKLDSSGNFVWAKQIGGVSGEFGTAISLGLNNSVYISGSFNGTVDFDPGSGIFNLSSPIGEQEIFIVKLDSQGNFLWAKQIGGDVGYALSSDNNGNIYVSGYYDWNAISISKFDALGNLIWDKQIEAHICYSIEAVVNGNIYLTGQFFGTKDFDPGSNTYNMTALGDTDAYICKLDSLGNFIWAKQIGGTSQTTQVLGRSIAVDPLENIYTVGSFNYTVDFDPSSFVYNLSAIQSYDIYIHKMKPTNLSTLENSFEDNFKIYPNPTEGNLILEFAKVFDNLNFVLKNSLGQILDVKSARNIKRIEIQVNEVSGIYFLEISDQKNQRAVVQIIKK